MKSLVLIISIFASVYSKAESIMHNYHVVVSDEFDASVAPGTCLVTGQTLDVNNNRISGGTISNFDRSRATVADSDGNYSLLLSIRDTCIFFYDETYGEIVIWKYNFQSQHKVVINFIAMEYSNIQTVEKPVIYLYSSVETNVNLSLKHDQLTFTYPSYNEGWNVTTSSDGGITNQADGKKYPYLFWEAKSENLAYKNSSGITFGSLIKTDSAVSFFENALYSLGLNSTEATDFITYWGPRVVQKEYAFIQFLIDDEVDETIAELTVTPKPENQRRIYLLFTPLDKPQVAFEFEPQVFTGFDRSGLTLVEWGGTELPLRTILQ